MSDDLEFKKWLRQAEEDMLPKMKASTLSLAIVPNKIDAKLCLEIGAAVLYNKPIVVVAVDGASIPPGLLRIASAVIEGAVKDEGTKERIQRAIEKVIATDERVQ